MDYDTDVHVVRKVSRTYNVYRGSSPATQNRLEVSTRLVLHPANPVFVGSVAFALLIKLTCSAAQEPFCLIHYFFGFCCIRSFEVLTESFVLSLASDLLSCMCYSVVHLALL